MRLPLRVSVLAAVTSAMTLVLTGAVPSGAPALFVGPGSRLAIGSQPVSTTPSEPPPGALRADAGVRELRRNYVDMDPSGVVRGVTAPPGQSLGPNADAFVTRYAGAFGLSKGHTLSREASVPLGSENVIRYQQVAGGLPVLGGQVVVTTAADGSVRGAVTDTSRLKPIGVSKVDAVTASAKGLAAAAAKYEIDPGATATASLWLYDASKNNPSAKAELRPTYWVKVVMGEEELASVLVDGIDASVKLVASEHQTSRRRLVCDLTNTRVNLNLRSSYACVNGSALATKPATRAEGGAPSSVADVNAAYDRLGIAYDYFKTNFNVDSFDGRGGEIRATVRACHLTGGCPYANAFWEGTQFVFGDGWAVDDVVFHEYTHAVTEYSSNLLYWFESGAINEAFSDIFGQFIDLQTPGDDAGIHRWEMGEDLAIGAIRDMLNPARFGDPIAYKDSNWDYDWDLSDNGGVHSNSGVANRVAALLYDGTTGVPALGATKSAQLWWRVMHLIPSGGDYRTLSVTLKAACRQFIGKFGFTAADCSGVEQVIAMGQLFPGRNPQPDLCPASPYQAPADLFYDGMENGSDHWIRSSSTYWDFIPSVTTPWSYASSGRGSINGWTSNTAGNGHTIEMKNAVNLPVGQPLFVAFEQAMIKDPSASGWGIDMFIDSGSGWQPLGGFSGIPGPFTRIDYTSMGFDPMRRSLDSFAGMNVKMKFQIASPSGQPLEWYMDNFRIYTCDPNVPGAPQDAFGYINGSNLELNWSRAGYFPAATSYDDYHYELNISPPLPGAPATFRGSGTGDRFTLSIPGADPSLYYTIKMRVKMDSAPGLSGPEITFAVSPFAPVSCQSDKPKPLALPSTGRRSAPPPYGDCVVVIIPRRG